MSLTAAAVTERWASPYYGKGTAESLNRVRQLESGNHNAKRAIDIVIGGMAIIAAMPLMLAIALVIKASSRGPALYWQRRVGFGGMHFYALKFRTMVDSAEYRLEHYLKANPHLRREWERDRKLRHDPRVTFVGRWLRRASLDELPQLWNVLTGQMSLVGPRPIGDAEIMKYGETFALYERVMPGLTGLWQVSGRGNTTFAQRVAFDSWYARNWSFGLDAVILLRTFKTVLLCEGAY